MLVAFAFAGIVLPIALHCAHALESTPQNEESKSSVDQTQVQLAIQKGIRYLRSTGQAEDGSFSKQLGPGITGIVLTGLLRTRQVSPTDPIVAKGLKHLEDFVQPDGAIAGP